MNKLFWKCIEDDKLSENISVNKLNKIYIQLIDKACHAFADYFNKDPYNHPKHPRFYSRPDDYYDGILLDSDHIYEFIEGIIMSGELTFNKFIKNPFDGDIMNNLKRDISCGNSSCLYLKPTISGEWMYLINDDDIYHKLITIDLLNHIFSIVVDPVLKKHYMT